MKKICTKCGILKDYSLYSPQKETRDGLKSWCKACMTKATVLHQKEHPDKKRERDKLYHIRHRAERLAKQKIYADANREHKREVDRQYAATHREEALQKAKAWYEKNKEKVSIYIKKYRAANLEKLKSKKSVYNKAHRIEKNARENLRRVRKQGNGGIYTKQEFINLCQKYGNACLGCKRIDVKLTADHVIPVILGGSNFIENIQPLCRSCNSKKGTKVIDYR